ncbi:MAG: polymer-forming cytoskeletal protein [Candidatus Berkelbacteria bacterium]
MENNVDTVIGLNVNVKGNIHNKGSIQINGSVEGEVKSDENVYIGETAKITGPVTATIIEVSGEVKGQITAKDKLDISSTGKLFGDIDAKVLVIKEGAVFVGNCSMPTDQPMKAKDNEIKTEKPQEIIIEEQVKEDDKLGFFSKK